MSLKGLATQAELATFQDTLNRMAANLAFHVNETVTSPYLIPGNSLSEAHGIDMIVGGTDADGNVVTEYQDSNGDLVSDAYTSGKANFVRFIVGGQPYYAPVQDSALSGQPVGSGALTSTDPTEGTPGGSTLITDYVTLEAQTAENIDSLLREHTQKPAESAHIPLTVVTEPTYDSAGHTVGTHLIRFQFGNIVYSIPVSSRLGGPPQGVRLTSTCPVASFVGATNGNFGLSGCTLNLRVKAGASWPTAVILTTTITGGTLPISYAWQYYNGSAWVDQVVGGDRVPPGGNGGLDPTSGISGTLTAIGALASQWAIDPPGGDNSNTAQMRLKLDNTAAGGGVVYGCTITMVIVDKASCCWFCTQSNITKRISPEDWIKVGTIEQELFRACRRMVAWYTKHGDQLVARMVAAGVGPDWFENFTDELLKTYQENGLEAAGKFYVSRVIEATKTYWPEYYHRGYRAGVIWRTSCG